MAKQNGKKPPKGHPREQAPKPEAGVAIEGPAKLHLSWQDIENLVNQILNIIDDHKSPTDRKHNFTQIIAVSRGGLVPAVMLSHMLEIPIKHVAKMSSYDAGNNQKGVQLDGILPALTTKEQETTLIVDDIVDSGLTLEALCQYYPRASYAALVIKPAALQRAVAFAARLYLGSQLKVDSWVVFPWEKED